MKKILIIEDDKFLSSAYKLKFEKAGFEVLLAFDGEEGLKKISEDKPDILLLDLIIPKRDGFSVLSEIKRIPELAKIPVVVASNLGQKEDIDRAKSLGANGYIVKSDLPISEVVEKIESLLSP